MQPDVNAVWIGPSLGPVHVACLKSFVRHGHSVTLHCYDTPIDVPKAVKIADARTLLPENSIFKYPGRFAVFSDLLRYEILAQGLGLYVDCDMFCLRPIEDEPYILGWEKQRDGNTALNNAVLKLPSDCPLLADLCKIRSDDWFPPWINVKKRDRYRKGRWPWSEFWRGRELLARLPFGSTGPIALTHYFKMHGLEGYAKPLDVFYPICGNHAHLLADPDLSLDDLVTHRTIAVHLGTGNIKSFATFPSTSPIGRIIAATA